LLDDGGGGPVNLLGTVAQCWRYPVKSMQGQPRSGLSITAAGVEGDRAWALIDIAANRILSAKRTAALLGARASDDAIELPDAHDGLAMPHNPQEHAGSRVQEQVQYSSGPRGPSCTLVVVEDCGR
jgi:uncharacterized protein YcbX